MPRVFLSLVLFVAGFGTVHSDEPVPSLELTAEDQLIVSGPVEMHLAYGEETQIEMNPEDWQISREGHTLRLTAKSPTVIYVDTPCIDKVRMNSGQLFIRVTGNQRMFLPEVSAPEIRLQLLGQARFDAEHMATEHLMVALSEQGKASLMHVEAELMEVDMTDHGDFDVAGQARRQQIEMSGYAHYNGGELQSEDVTVALSDYSAGSIKTINTPIVSTTPFASLSAR